MSIPDVASRQVTLVPALARNALVRGFKVDVTATRADTTTLANAGQVRLQADSDGSKIIVVDFGMLRTVSGIGLVKPGAMTICSLRAFKGDGFDTTDLYLVDCDSGLPTQRTVRSVEQNTFETRTERVRLKVKTSADLTTIAANVWLQFPDPPSDLDIRINGGAPAWTAPGVAQPDTHGWDADTHQVVDLTDALAALTGNALDSRPLDASIVLASRTPGLLTLTPGDMDVAYLARILFDGAEETTLVLDQEGHHDLVLHLPEWVGTVQEVRLTLTGTVPPERILEPVGPPLALRLDGLGPAYDLLLDVDHAGAAQLDAAKPLDELVAVRLPLRAGADGAEVHAVLHEGTKNGPTRPVDGGTSKPVDLAPAAAGEVWTSFTLAKPIKLTKPVKPDADLRYWVVVVVGRGGAAWSLGRFATAAETVPILRGGANGPWHELPAMLDGATLGARIRAVGTAPPNVPILPLSITVVGHETSQVSVSPTPKGVTATWIAPPRRGRVFINEAQLPSPPPPPITLQVTSRMTGTVKVSAVDVVATK
jgi:hypothetical protein